MKSSTIKAYILVTIQFACMIFIFFSAPFKANHIITLIIETAGGILIIWSILTMKLDNLSASPEIKKNARLVTKGPYYLIRHPMYTSIFLALIPLVIDYFTWFRLAILVVLLINQLIKLHFEERLLLAQFPDYAEYAKRTKKLIPFIY
jgi:protein-S-isoprenylcysteine O-methyltransferase Ste14